MRVKRTEIIIILCVMLLWVAEICPEVCLCLEGCSMFAMLHDLNAHATTPQKMANRIGYWRGVRRVVAQYNEVYSIVYDMN